MGMNRLISHNPTPTTIKAKTRLIRGICVLLFLRLRRQSVAQWSARRDLAPGKTA
jgi:hypothetical protein